MDLWHLFPLLILLLITSYLFFLTTENAKSRNSPPGPSKLPILGNLHQVAGNMSNIRRLAKKHGALMQLQLGSTRALVVSSASMAKEIFGSHDLTFSGRPPLYVARKLSYGCSNIAFSPPDEHWKAVKKMAVVELLSMKRVQSFRTIRDEEVARMLDSILESRGVVDVSRVTLALANNVLCRAVFGRSYHRINNLQELLLETQALFGEFNWADFYPWIGSMVNKVNGFDARLEKIFGTLDGFFEDVIEEHLRRGRPKAEDEDLVDVLLQVQKDPTHSIRLHKNNIKGIFLVRKIWAVKKNLFPGNVAKVCDLIRHFVALSGNKQKIGFYKFLKQELDISNDHFNFPWVLDFLPQSLNNYLRISLNLKIS